HDALPIYKIATLEHILNDCGHMNGMMHARHNRAQTTIMDHLVSTGWTVYKNPRVVTLMDSRWRCFVPDIIAVSPDGNDSLVLDVQCSFEIKRGVLNERDATKREKYSHPAIIDAIKIKLGGLGHSPRRVEVYGLVFGSRGAISNVTYNILIDLGMSKSRIGSILDFIAKDSMTMYR